MEGLTDSSLRRNVSLVCPGLSTAGKIGTWLMVFKDRKITTKEYDFDLPEAQFTAINDRC